MSWFRKYIRNKDSVFIVAEAGINHNGDIELALELVRKAKDCGAGCIKFQTFKTDACESKQAVLPKYFQDRIHVKDKHEWSKSLEFNLYQFKKLKEYCDEIGILFLSTACDIESLKNLCCIGVCAVKIGSSDTNNLPLLRETGRTGLPVILSTGISSEADIDFAVDALRDNGTSDLTILHCTSQYPVPVDQVDLRVIPALIKRYRCPVGYSDHTAGIHIAVAAVTLGAKMIEKHFTLNRNLSGVDHKASLEPAEFRQMVSQIRDIEMALGKDIKTIQPCEKSHLVSMRKSLVAARPIPESHILQYDDIAVKRPGGGIPPSKIDQIVGKQIVKHIEADELLTMEIIADDA